MLRVLDAKSLLALTGNRFVNFQDLIISAVPDRVNRNLQVVSSSVSDGTLHSAVGHRRHCQAAIFRIVEKRFEKRRGGRAEGSVGESFESTDAKAIASESLFDGRSDKPLVFQNRGIEINARSEAAAFFELLIGAEIFVRLT